jgi:hypothetical protein
VTQAWGLVRPSTIINGFVRCDYIDRSDQLPEDAPVDEQVDDLYASDVVAELAEHGEIVGRPLTEEMDIVDRYIRGYRAR